jgi:hypothetical protein
MVLAETPEKNATEKLAPVIVDNLPSLMRGCDRVASLWVQFMLSIKLARKRPRVMKKVSLISGRMTCGHIVVMRSCSMIFFNGYRVMFCSMFLTLRIRGGFAISMVDSLPARYYTLQAGKKIIIVALRKNKLFLQEHE